MDMQNKWDFLSKSAMVIALFVAGCAAPPVTTDSNDEHVIVDSRHHFKISVPKDWVRESASNDSILLTRDGKFIHFIEIDQHPLDNAFPRLRERKRNEHSITPEIDLLTLGERFIAELKLAINENLEILQTSQVTLSGHDAYRLDAQFTSEDGLRIGVSAYALVTPQGFFEIDYVAPLLYFYARDLAAFEEVAASFQMLEPHPK